MYKISVTMLESFRRFVNEVSLYDTEEKLVQSLSGEFKGNSKTFYGTGFHSIIEGEYKKTPTGNIIASDIEFSQAQAYPAFQYAKAHHLMVHEMNLSKIFNTKYGPIQVGGRVDGIEGVTIRDIKTKYKAPRVDEYMASYQWRFYLNIMELEVFYFDIFEVRKFDDFDISQLVNPEIKNKTPIFLPNAIIEPYPEIPCLAYERMEEDCLSLLNEFLGFIEMRDYWHFLKPAKEIELFQ